MINQWLLINKFHFAQSAATVNPVETPSLKYIVLNRLKFVPLF